MRKIFALVIAGMASWTAPVAAKAPATDLTYSCSIDGKPTVYLNITRHRFRFADQSGPLNEGLKLNFTTARGFTMYLNLGDVDQLRDTRPTYVEGSVTVSKDAGPSAPERVFCAMSGAARAGRQTPARSTGEIEALRRQYDDADGWCRGGSGAASDSGCARRERVSKQLEARGQCYSRETNETGGHDEVWRRCP
jgi:hypothetical protein